METILRNPLRPRVAPTHEHLLLTHNTRGPREAAAFAAQAESPWRLLDAELIRSIFDHVLMPFSIPKLVSAIGIVATCKLFSILFHDLATPIDCRLIYENTSVSGDHNYFGQRFLVHGLARGCKTFCLTGGETEGYTLSVVRQTRATEDDFGRPKLLVGATADSLRGAHVCVELAIDDAVQLFSGYDRKHSLVVNRAPFFPAPVCETVPRLAELDHIPDSDDLDADVTHIGFRLVQTPAGDALEVFRHKEHLPFAVELGRLSATDTTAFRALFGYEDSIKDVACRYGPHEDDCFIAKKDLYKPARKAPITTTLTTLSIANLTTGRRKAAKEADKKLQEVSKNEITTTAKGGILPGNPQYKPLGSIATASGLRDAQQEEAPTDPPHLALPPLAPPAPPAPAAAPAAAAADYIPPPVSHNFLDDSDSD
jgi:hypothetical protein